MSPAGCLEATAILPPFLSATASIIFIVILPYKLWTLYRTERKLLPSWLAPAKAILGLAICAASAATLMEALQRFSHVGQLIAVSEVALSCVSALGLCWLSVVEHRRSVRPSTLATSYLLASVLFETAWVAAPNLSGCSIGQTFFGLVIGQICVKVALLTLELKGKEAILYPSHQGLAPEDTAGILRNAVFWWINPILARGAKAILALEDLPPVTQSLSSDALWESMSRAWLPKSSSESNLALPVALVRCLSAAMLGAVLPRVLLIVFQYAQPLLIRQTIRFVNQWNTQTDSRATAFWLVLVAMVVYVGLAFSTAIYQHRLNNIRVMSRGALVGLVYNRVHDIWADASQKGAAVTLMSTDVDNLSDVIGMILDLGGYAAGVVIGLLMLYQEVGWLCFLPVLFIVFGTRVSQYVAKNLRSRQKAWSAKTQERIAAVASMLGSMKAIKSLGLAGVVANNIRQLRLAEIENANKIRWVMVVYNASANALGIFTPIITIILYAVTASGSLDAETAFTTVALLTMVIHPANMVMTIAPRLVASFASFERLHLFLQQATRQDQRVISTQTSEIRIEHAVVAPVPACGPILKDVSLTISSLAVVIVTGAVGSGKSTLANVILGGIPLDRGSVTVPAGPIGLCSQSPWLPDGSVRDVICAYDASADQAWYEKVVRACCLDHDLAALPGGDATAVGGQGMNLSGGQRQRVALARLLYSRCRVVILDDSFSALDVKTCGQVINNLLGRDGLLREMGTTVIWISNNSSYFHLADRVLLVKSGLVTELDMNELLNKSVVESHTDDAKGDINLHAALAEPQQVASKLQSQRRAQEDAADDLTRKTGDISLYVLYFRQAGIFNSLVVIICTAGCAFFMTFPQYWLRLWTEADADRAVMFMVGYVVQGLLAWALTSITLWATYMLMAATSGRRLHQTLLEIVIGAPLSFFAKNNIGMTLNRFSQDIGLIDTQLPIASQTLATQISKLLVQVGILVTVQQLLLLTLPVCLAVIYLIQRVYLQTSRQLRFLDLESRSEVFSSFLETVEGIATLRAFGWQDQARSHSIQSLDKSQRASYILLCLQRWLNLVLDLMVAAIAIGLIALAVSLSRGRPAGGAAVGVALNIVLLANTTLLRLVESWTTMEISLSAIARLKSMRRDTPGEERAGESHEPPAAWPSEGRLEIKGVTASYGSEVKALSEVSLNIAAGQKALLCGRTGSGKSTTMLVLLRLIEYTGTVTVDGIDITTVPLAVLRQRCFITIPQESYFMTDATLRFNMDPEGKSTDKRIIRALKRVHLWAKLSHQAAPEPLGEALSASPALSAGQLQLLALARALVRRETLRSEAAQAVLLLDEATSSLDPETERVVQDVIDEEFSANGHTVVMITHRPQTAAAGGPGARDVVVWMSDGRVESVSSP